MKRTCSILALLLVIFVVAAASATAEQATLASHMTRLHVVANSDSEPDQALKLKVRDAVLAAALRENGAPLEALKNAAISAVLAEGYSYPVSVSHGVETFGTRKYDSFSLPAGNYDAVRVTIGDGAGNNWWCVLFPPLCFASAEQFETAARDAGFSQDEIAVMGGGGNVEIKFRILELLNGWFN